jgi:hypothetical protein
MLKQIVFGSGPRSHILEELEDYRKTKQVDHLIQRALRPDSNLLIFDEVMNCVDKGPVSSKAYKTLIKALLPALTRGTRCPKTNSHSADGHSDGHNLAATFLGQPGGNESAVEDDTLLEVGLTLDPSMLLRRFLFIDDVLPGNAKAESFCTSADGSMLAYLSMAAAPLQALQGRYVRQSFPRMPEASSHDTARPATSSPRIVNVVSLDPYDFWTLSLDDILHDLILTGLELVWLDGNHLYATQSTGVQKRLIDIGVRDGVLHGSYDLGDHCGALFLDIEGKRCTFIDTALETLNRLSLSDGSQQSHPLSLPSGLSARDLRALEFTPDGTVGVILVGPRSDSSDVLMAIVRAEPCTDHQAWEFAIRWIKRKEAWLEFGFEKVRFSSPHMPTDSAAEAGVFYFIDTTVTIHSLSVSSLIRQKLEEIDPAHLFSAIPASKGGKKAAFPAMTIGSERPLLVTYSMATERISVWDTSTSSLLVSLPCPFQVDRLELVAHDTLLIAKSRSVRSTRDRLAVTFLDFLFLAGQAPTSLNDDCIPVLEPLEAWAPGNALLDFMRRLAAFNKEHTKEVSA